MRTIYTKKCKHCKKPFKTFDINMEFCNLACKFDYEEPKEIDIKIGREIIEEIKPRKKCIICGWEFIARRKTQLCCCKECHRINARNMARRRYHYQYKKIDEDEEMYD